MRQEVRRVLRTFAVLQFRGFMSSKAVLWISRRVSWRAVAKTHTAALLNDARFWMENMNHKLKTKCLYKFRLAYPTKRKLTMIATVSLASSRSMWNFARRFSCVTQHHQMSKRSLETGIARCSSHLILVLVIVLVGEAATEAGGAG